MLVGGALGDRYGRRRSFLLGAGVFALGALSCAAVTSVPLLLAARTAEGLGGAVLVPASLALIGTYFDPGDRGRAIGTWAGASALAAAIAPVIGGWLVDSGGWRTVFLFVAPAAGIAFLVAWRHLPSDRPLRERPLDYWGALLLLVTLGLAIAAIMGFGVTSIRVALAMVALATGAAFVARERRSPDPVLPFRLFGSARFSAANAMTFLLYAALGGTLYFLPFNLIQVQGYSATEAGAALLPMTLLLAAGSTTAGGSLSRFDARTVLTLGSLLCALGFFALTLPSVRASYASAFLPPTVLLGLGMTLSAAPLTTVVMGAVDEQEVGTASGVNNTVSRLSGVIAVATLTALAIGWFAGSLRSELARADLPAALTERLVADAAELADLRPPLDVEPAAARASTEAIKLAYVGTFRRLMAISGALALASALVSWFSFPTSRDPSSRNPRARPASTGP